MLHTRKRRISLVIIIMFLWALAVPHVYADTTTVQIPASSWDYLGGEDSPATWSRLGQRVVLDNTEVFSIGYRVCRVGSPTGDITLSIRDSATDAVIFSKVWGDASELPDANNNTYSIVDITPSLKVSGDVRICVEYYGGNETDYCQAGYYSGDKITGQWYTNYANYATDVDGWHDIGEAEEGSYRCTYIAESSNGNPDNGHSNGHGFNWKLLIGVTVAVVAMCLIPVVYYSRKKEDSNA